MQTKLIIRVADKHGSVGCQPASKSRFHSKLHEKRAKLIGISRASFEIERQLTAIALESEKSL